MNNIRQTLLALCIRPGSLMSLGPIPGLRPQLPRGAVGVPFWLCRARRKGAYERVLMLSYSCTQMDLRTWHIGLRGQASVMVPLLQPWVEI